MAINQKKISDFKELFLKWQEWEDRYRELIKIGKKLPPLEEKFKTEDFRIKGCQSQVWLAPQFESGKVHFKADSDAMIVKGIVGLLVGVFSNETPKDILETEVDFLKELGIIEHLSMNRSNGLASMVKQIKMYAFAYQHQN